MKLDLTGTVLTNVRAIHQNLGVAELYEEAVKNGEAQIALEGPLVARTGQYTGRSPNDKFVVSDEASKDKIWWKGAQPMESAQFDRLLARQEAFLQGRPVYVTDCWAGADPVHRIPIRVVTEMAWHSLFARNMFVREEDPKVLDGWKPAFTVLHTPNLKAIPGVDSTRSEVFIAISFTRNMVLIGGSLYAGEIKKSVFTVLNYLLPQRGVLGMHCSANIGPNGDTALFFGLSGTGKTTLSADPERSLIGDDEHGWSDDGVFNFEGGCYAKVINLSPEAEPEIYATTRRFGTILENVPFHPSSRKLDLDSRTLTENTRASYPIDFIPNTVPSGRGGHPKNIIMLTCDAFGVLPPIAKLTPEQAMYHFISGYTAKIAGTERGVTEPKETFSACFGAPFMALHPAVYAKLLGEKIARHNVTSWLVNTGWSGGPYGVGARMKIAYSRALVRAALSGVLEGVPMRKDPIFGFSVPESCPGVPAEVLDPRRTWKSPEAYDDKAHDLARRFAKNFEAYASVAPPAVQAAGPKVSG